MAQPKAKMNIPMCAAAVLLCLTLFSLHLMSGLYAKYVSKDSGSDSARVAAFNVITTGDVGDGVSVDCYDKTDDTYTIEITNESEVAVRYTISVALDGPAASGVAAVLDADSGELAVGAPADERTLTFNVNNWSAITKDANSESVAVDVDFTVTVDVVQID